MPKEFKVLVNITEPQIRYATIVAAAITEEINNGNHRAAAAYLQLMITAFELMFPDESEVLFDFMEHIFLKHLSNADRLRLLEYNEKETLLNPKMINHAKALEAKFISIHGEPQMAPTGNPSLN